MKKTKVKAVAQVSAIVIVLVMLLSTTVFAEATIFEINDEWLSVSGKLKISNIQSEIPELKNTTINLVSIDTEASKENSEYEYSRQLSQAVVVSNPASLLVELEKPAYCDLKIYKITKKGDKYTYIYRSELPISSGQVERGDELDIYHSGVIINITEPGEYFVDFTLADDAAISGGYAYVKVEGESSSAAPAPVTAAPTATVATPTSSKVLVNGKDTSFDAYTINGNNYFKLRDLALVVSGTEKQFEVKWDGEKSAINLISSQAYTTVGGEMAAGDGKEKAPVLNTSKIYKDGQEVALTAYTINGNNYFKLRDIAKAFNIGITWDGTTNTVGIDTSIDYVAP